VQTTLLGLAIAIILALTAALVGPHFVDWNQYRAEFETNASAYVGVPVRVGGDIDVRILPVPSLVLHRVEVGPRGERPKLRADVLDIKLALGPLFKGELNAAELRLVGPEFRVALDRSGRIEAPVPGGFGSRDTVSIERLSIQDGRAVLADAATGSQLAVNALAFDGEVRSLRGPFRGEGSFISGGERYGYRLTSGRVGDNASAKLRFSLEPSHQPLSIETDGTLTFDKGAPSFEGTLALRRTAKGALRGGEPEQPWSVTSRLKATRTGAVFEQAELQYGTDARAIKLNGSAEVAFENRLRLTGALVARQIDLDRALDLPEAAKRFPITAVGQLSQGLRSAVRFPGTARLSLSADGVTFAGAGLTAVSADIEDRGEGWTLDKIEFRAPGLTQVSLSGRLTPTRQGTAAFNGAVGLETAQPQAFLSWLQGGADVSLAGIGSLQLIGDVAADSERFAIERLRGDIDRRKIEGRLIYAFAGNGRRHRARRPELHRKVVRTAGRGVARARRRPRESGRRRGQGCHCEARL
jgi:AsmA-like protein